MPRKDKNIPSWQKSTFDQNSCVETKPISVKAIKEIEKEFYDKNKDLMRVAKPELYEFYRKEFGKKKKLGAKSKSDLKTVSCKDHKHEERLSFKCPDHVKQEDELTKYQKEREIERKKKLDQLRQHPLRPMKFETYRKDPCRGMGWVNSFQPINQGRLGHSQTWKMKTVKKYRYYE